MTFILFTLGVLLVGTTARLLIHAVVLPRLRLHAHLQTLQSYGFAGVDDEDEQDKRSRLNVIIGELAVRLGKLALKKAPSLKPLGRGELAAAAIYDVMPETVHGYRVMAAIGFPALFIFYFMNAGGFSLLGLVLVVGSAGAGWQLPAFLIHRRGRSRLEQIDRYIPDLIDLLTATVEAGMGVAGSINLVADRFKGALGDELRLTLKQQSLGISSRQALEDMVERCDTASMRAFVRTVTRGESLGVSIGPILRELAVDVRRRRRQAAQEKMQKAPVKMLFPIMLLIFPALMLVLMFPAAYSLLRGLGGG